MGTIALPLWQRLAPYQQNRLLTFLNPEADPRAAGYHAIQSRVAIGSGGWFGTGYTQGPQKRLAFLPEQHTDFVFPVVGEELGFVGVMVALSLFLALFLALLRIARRATDSFSSLVGVRHPRTVLHPRLRERRHDGEPDADHRHSAAVLLLRRLVLHHLLALPRARLPGGLGLAASQAILISDNDLGIGVWRLGQGLPEIAWRSETVVASFTRPDTHYPMAVMAWFKKERKPRTSQRERLEIPPDAWEKCDGCGHIDIREKFEKALNVCPECGRHRRIARGGLHRAADRSGHLARALAGPALGRSAAASSTTPSG